MIAVPPAAVVGLAFLCGCCPLISLVNMGCGEWRRRRFRDIWRDISMPGVLGSVFFLGLLDVVYLPLPLLWCAVSYFTTRIRFGNDIYMLFL